MPMNTIDLGCGLELGEFRDRVYHGRMTLALSQAGVETDRTGRQAFAHSRAEALEEAVSERPRYYTDLRGDGIDKVLATARECAATILAGKCQAGLVYASYIHGGHRLIGRAHLDNFPERYTEVRTDSD